MKINLPPLHPKQAEVADHPARFKVLACGRRWGKTRLGVSMACGCSLEGGRSWGVAPSWSIGMVGWRGLKEVCRQIPGHRVSESTKTIEFPTLGSDAAISVKSGEEPDLLRGEGLDLLVTDESAFMRRECWYEALRPALSDKMGSALIIGTPKGRNWFYDEFTRGRDPLETDYMCWQMPSWTNPYFPSEEWGVAKRNLPEDVFRQEYEAEFLTDSAGVFRGVQDVLSDSTICDHKNSWVIGADIAKHTDFSVFTVMCRSCGQCREQDRFQKVDWPLQKQRIEALSMRYGNAVVYLDATGLGDPIYDDLKARNVNVEGVKMSLPKKVELIQKLIVDIEQRKLKIPKTWKVTIDELARYEYKYTSQGSVSYGAPQGYHDDCVISLALANFGRRRARAWVLV